MVSRSIALLALGAALALPLSAQAGSVYIEFAGTAGCTAGATSCTASPSATGITVNIVFNTTPSPTGTVGYGISVEWDRPADVGGTPLLTATGFTETVNPPLGPASPGSIAVFTQSTAAAQGKAYTFENVGFSSLGTGTITVGTITFDAKGNTGTTTLYSGSFNTTVDAISDSFGAQYTPGFSDAVLTLVPEPSTAALLGMGLFGLVAAGRRGRR